MLRDVVTTAAYQHGELHAENDKLRMLIKRLLRHRFGRRSEQLGADQLQFGLEDLEQTVAANQAGQEAADAAAGRQRRRSDAQPNRNHGALPDHLPRYEVVIAAPARCRAARCGCASRVGRATYATAATVRNSPITCSAPPMFPWWRRRQSGRSMAAW